MNKCYQYPLKYKGNNQYATVVEVVEVSFAFREIAACDQELIGCRTGRLVPVPTPRQNFFHLQVRELEPNNYTEP